MYAFSLLHAILISICAIVTVHICPKGTREKSRPIHKEDSLSGEIMILSQLQKLIVSACAELLFNSTIRGPFRA